MSDGSVAVITPRSCVNNPAIARLAATERYARMRREAREAADLDSRKLFDATEVSATPNLRWLSVGARFEAVGQRPPRKLPPLALLRRDVPRQPLVTECGEAASCPVCLLDITTEETSPTGEAPGMDHGARAVATAYMRLSHRLPSTACRPGEPTVVQWTLCCGRVFHEKCLQRCGRLRRECPTCRTRIFPDATEMLSAPQELHSPVALQLQPLDTVPTAPPS